MEEENIYEFTDSKVDGQREREQGGQETPSPVLTFSMQKCWLCKCPMGTQTGRPRPHAVSEGLVVIAVSCPVPKHLAGVAVGPLLPPAAVVCGVWRLLQHLRLGRAVLGVVEIKAATDVAEEARRLLGQAFLLTAKPAPARVKQSNYLS